MTNSVSSRSLRLVMDLMELNGLDLIELNFTLKLQIVIKFP